MPRRRCCAAVGGAADSLLFNAGAADDALRTDACLPNVLHSLPSRAMLADALVQFLALRQWKRWLLVVGPRPRTRPTLPPCAAPPGASA